MCTIYPSLFQMLADIRPNEEHAKEHIERNPVTTVAQVVPEMSEHEVRSCFPMQELKHVALHAFYVLQCAQRACLLTRATLLITSLLTAASRLLPQMIQVNTTAVVFATKAMNHVEGGWPKEVDYTEAEHVIRYRKKVVICRLYTYSVCL